MATVDATDDDLTLPDLNATIAAAMRAAAASPAAQHAEGLGLDLTALDAGFERALVDLGACEARLAGLVGGVAGALEGASRSYAAELQTLQGDMAALSATHEAMGERYRRVGWRAKQIGGELAAAAAQRLRAAEALDLLREFSTLTSLPAVKQRAKANQARAAERLTQSAAPGASEAGSRGGSRRGSVGGLGGSLGGGLGGSLEGAGRAAIARDVQTQLPEVANGGLGPDGACGELRAVAVRLRALHGLTSGLGERHPGHAAGVLAVQVAVQVAEEALLARFEQEWQRLTPRDWREAHDGARDCLAPVAEAADEDGAAKAELGQLFLRSVAMQP
jgi:hypothetical protein